MAGARDPRVDAYVAALPPWQRQVCTERREPPHGREPTKHAGER